MKRFFSPFTRLIWDDRLEPQGNLFLGFMAFTIANRICEENHLRESRYYIGLFLLFVAIRKGIFLLLYLIAVLNYSSTHPNEYRGRKFSIRKALVLAFHIKKPREYQRIGYRFARLMPTSGGRLQFCGVVYPVLFGAQERATCHEGSQKNVAALKNTQSALFCHTAPEEDCHCGWYSRISIFSLLRLTAFRFVGPQYNRRACLLECSYTGKIIPGQLGSRAENQHVLRAWIPEQCSTKRCRQKADCVAVFSEDLEAFDMSYEAAPHCAEHAAPALKRWSLADMRGDLGCEVTFV